MPKGCRRSGNLLGSRNTINNKQKKKKKKKKKKRTEKEKQPTDRDQESRSRSKEQVKRLPTQLELFKSDQDSDLNWARSASRSSAVTDPDDEPCPPASSGTGNKMLDWRLLREAWWSSVEEASISMPKSSSWSGVESCGMEKAVGAGTGGREARYRVYSSCRLRQGSLEHCGLGLKIMVGKKSLNAL